MEIVEYIFGIFNQHLVIVFSWGFSYPRAIEQGLRFAVQGFIHKGDVDVIYDGGSDLFCVRLLNADGSVIKEQDGINLDGLVDCIDKLVERVPDYEEKVRKTYGK